MFSQLCPYHHFSGKIRHKLTYTGKVTNFSWVKLSSNISNGSHTATLPPIAKKKTFPPFFSFPPFLSHLIGAPPAMDKFRSTRQRFRYQIMAPNPHIYIYIYYFYGVASVVRTSWIKKNPCRWFYCCVNMGFFLALGFCLVWAPICERATELIPCLIKRIDELEEESWSKKKMLIMLVGFWLVTVIISLYNWVGGFNKVGSLSLSIECIV